MSTEFTRQRFLKAASAGATWIVLSNVPGCKPKQAQSGQSSPVQAQGNVWAFRSRPDLRPPAVEVTTQAHDTAPGYVFATPKGGDAWQGGAMILDDRGQVAWFSPIQSSRQSGRLFVMDFKVQNYQGRPVLTWEEGGEYVILDDSYEEIARLSAGNGYEGDHHEFLITPQATALVTIYNSAPADLSPVGGPKDGRVTEGIVQELNIETGEVLFEWKSLDHIGIDETYVKLGQRNRAGLDYFHINSIEVDRDDNLLVSARSTFAVYKIDRKSGEVIWRLGGKKSDFEMGPGTRFAYQHDARRQPDGTITIFDNGTTVFEDGRPKAVEGSRGIVLGLDEEEMTAVLVRDYTHPDKQFAHAGANMQVLPNGNAFVGWGQARVFSEFSKEGQLLYSASFSRDASYRAFRFPWRGQPSDQPVAVAERASEDEVKVYVSWNGATEVATWQVLAGSGPDRLEPIKAAPREGFETGITVNTAEPYVAVQAKHSSGKVLGTTKPVKS